MTDVLAPVLVPYARFLEVRTRRLQRVCELTEPAPERALDAAASAPMAIDERPRAAVRILVTEAVAGV